VKTPVWQSSIFLAPGSNFKQRNNKMNCVTARRLIDLRLRAKVFFPKDPYGGKNTCKTQPLDDNQPAPLSRVFFRHGSKTSIFG
jgi:hypothetical protein